MSLTTEAYYRVMCHVVESKDFAIKDIARYSRVSKLLHELTMQALYDVLRSRPMYFMNPPTNESILAPYGEGISSGVGVGKRVSMSLNGVGVTFIYNMKVTTITGKAIANTKVKSFTVDLSSEGLKDTIIKPPANAAYAISPRSLPSPSGRPLLELIKKAYPELYRFL